MERASAAAAPSSGPSKLSFLRKLASRACFVLGAGYLAIIASLMAMETKLVYPGASGGDFEATHVEHQDVWIDSSDGIRVHAWYLAAERKETASESSKPPYAIILCHGNAENISSMLDEADHYRRLHHLDVLIFDYRGFGKTPGTPDEAGVKADAEAAWRWLSNKTQLESNRIFVFGRSLGGGVAVHLAAKFGTCGLILDRTFSSIPDVAASMYWYVPVRAVIKNNFNSRETIQEYTGPLLMLHGDVDEVIPIRFAQKLFESSPSSAKEFIEAPGTTHLDPWPELFFQATDNFIMTYAK